MRLVLPVLLAAMMLMLSCKDAGEHTSSKTVTTATQSLPPAPESNMGKEATDEFMGLMSAYYILKDALVAANGAKADEAASKLMSAAELFHSGMGPIPRKNELQEQLRVVMSKTEAIMASKADSIENKRAQFSAVSDAVYQIATMSNLHHAGIYHQFCPMAMNDKGAYWLSAESEIKNPYFGKKMIECGETKDSL